MDEAHGTHKYLNGNLNISAMEEPFLIFLLKCLYLMLPAYFANMAPVIVKKINFLAYPVDFNKRLNNKPILGSHKTFRGFFFGIIFAVIIAYLQHIFYPLPAIRTISFHDYDNWLAFGFLMGAGALVGDSIKSFFKRKDDIAPGNMFFPFDQVDFVIGGLIFIMPLFSLTIGIFFTSIAVSLVLHVLVNHIAFYLKIRNEKW